VNNWCATTGTSTAGKLTFWLGDALLQPSTTLVGTSLFFKEQHVVSGIIYLLSFKYTSSQAWDPPPS
jgi:hypothetical protein